MPSKIIVENTTGGSWEARTPTFGRTFKALLRRSFLLKIRDVGTIISEVVATVLFVIFGIIRTISYSNSDAITDSPVLTDDELFGSITYLYAVASAIGEGGCFVARPDQQLVKDYVANYYNNNQVYLSETPINIAPMFRYFNDLEDIRELFAKTNALGIGVGFNNIDDEDWIHDAKISLYQGSSTASFLAQHAKLGSQAAFMENGKRLIAAYKEVETELGISLPLPADAVDFKAPQISTKRMAKPALETALPINVIAVFIACMPIIISSMPDLSIVLNDKDSHMMTFIFLMGASETSYWFVTFLSSFIMCFIPYIVVTILFCTWCGLQGTNYILLLILTILFIISFLCFQFFLSTFFKTTSAGRVLTVIFLIAILFFGYMNEMYTLDAPDVAKHILSIFPLEPYELIIHVMYDEVRNKRPGLGFGDFTADLRYPIYYCFIWEIVDIILWGGLFILFNAILDRGFGSPPLKWSELFTCHSQAQREIDLEDISSGESIMKVDGLTKRYKGSDRNAVDNVSFDIKKGEIIVMIGPNGAGKSTIINTVSGAIQETSGTLALGGGEPLEKFTGIQNCLGIVFQDNVIMKVISIKEHLEIFGAIRGIDNTTLEDSINYFADLLQLREMLPNRAGDLSGGQKRKLCIALALLGNPPIIIMDEPTAGVDVQARQLIWKAIADLKDSTCIVTTHALEEAEAVSSRMFVVSEGKIPFIGTSNELRNEFKCGYLLKIDCEPEEMPDILHDIQHFIPEAKMMPEKDDTIMLPVVPAIPDMLSSLNEKKEKFGIKGYSFAVEQLEDVLVRILQK